MVDYAVITAKDEADTIGELIDALREQGIYSVVINDGSRDDTGFIAESNGAVVIHHASPEGIARSLLEAWQVAVNQRADRIVQIDAGGSHDPYEAGKLLDALPGYNIVIGSRFLPGSVYDGRDWRAKGSRLAAKMMNFAATGAYRKYTLTDWTSGYRAFTKDTIKRLLRCGYYERMHPWQLEVLVEAVNLGMRFTEVPITYKASGSSFKFRMLDGAIRQWLRMLYS
jgi:glycosyltransferase involved in cell wall biosynthesis